MLGGPSLTWTTPPALSSRILLLSQGLANFA
jgi:hypothetical protein